MIWVDFDDEYSATHNEPPIGVVSSAGDLEYKT